MNYKLIKPFLPDSNFSIILPGDCNANCHFCFWKKSNDISDDYIKQLTTILRHKLDKKVTQISLTGGEPTLSPYFDDVIQLINRIVPHVKVVLTTNGSNLLEKFPYIGSIVNHINISRPSPFNDKENQQIFQTKDIPTYVQILEICEKANALNIDITYNTVVGEHFNTIKTLDAYIDYIKHSGASALTIRKDISCNNLDPLPLELTLMEMGYKGSSNSCPVCVTNSYMCKGIRLNFKMGLKETGGKQSHIHEFIFHPDGSLTEDWEGDIPVEFEEVELMQPSWDIKPTMNGCHALIPANHKGYHSCIQSRSCGQEPIIEKEEFQSCGPRGCGH